MVLTLVELAGLTANTWCLFDLIHFYKVRRGTFLLKSIPNLETVL